MACIDPSLTEETHEGQRNSVGNSSSRRQCRRLQRSPEPLADHGPTGTGTSGTKNRETLSRTGRTQVVQKASCEVCCGFASAELFCVGPIHCYPRSHLCADSEIPISTSHKRFTVPTCLSGTVWPQCTIVIITDRRIGLRQ